MEGRGGPPAAAIASVVIQVALKRTCWRCFLFPSAFWCEKEFVCEVVVGCSPLGTFCSLTFKKWCRRSVESRGDGFLFSRPVNQSPDEKKLWLVEKLEDKSEV